MRFFIFCTLLLIKSSLCAQQLKIKGIYTGKNLYVQNPFTSDMKTFCTKEVWINGKLVYDSIATSSFQSAYEIDLSGFRINDTVEIKIFHHNDCKPKILNYPFRRHMHSFAFLSFEVRSDSITWKTKGEKEGEYKLEQFVNNTWTIINKINVRKDSSYSAPSIHHSHLNKYRVKYIDKNGQVFYSQVAEYESDIPRLEITPSMERKILFSREAPYELLDAYGNILESGYKKEIETKNLKEGTYYINTDNRTIKFFVKESKVRIKKRR
ncbi:MAG: hypothetical protein K2X86_11830 [Cytophagaceae bacterium]|nr:hypothetical protein [Cytophagaceae bacterium]